MKKSVFVSYVVVALVNCAAAGDFWEKSGAGDWKEYPQVALELAKAYGAGFSRDGEMIKVENTDAAKAAGAGWFLKLNQKKPSVVRFSADACAFGELKGDALQIFADVTFADGSALHAQRVRYSVNPAVHRPAAYVTFRYFLTAFYKILLKQIHKVMLKELPSARVDKR